MSFWTRSTGRAPPLFARRRRHPSLAPLSSSRGTAPTTRMRNPQARGDFPFSSRISPLSSSGRCGSGNIRGSDTWPDVVDRLADADTIANAEASSHARGPPLRRRTASPEESGSSLIVPGDRTRPGTQPLVKREARRTTPWVCIRQHQDTLAAALMIAVVSDAPLRACRFDRRVGPRAAPISPGA